MKHMFRIRRTTRLLSVGVLCLAVGCASPTKLYVNDQPTEVSASKARLVVERTPGMVGAAAPILILIQASGASLDRGDLHVFLHKGVRVEEIRSEGDFSVSGRRLSFPEPTWQSAGSILVSVPAGMDKEYAKQKLREYDRAKTRDTVRNPGEHNVSSAQYNALAGAAVAVIAAEMSREDVDLTKDEFLKGYCEAAFSGLLIGQVGPGGSLSYFVTPGDYTVYAWVEPPVDKNQFGWDNRVKTDPVDVRLQKGEQVRIVLKPQFLGSEKIEATIIK